MQQHSQHDHDVLLHVEMPEATAWQRKKLESSLTERQWVPLDEEADLWCVTMRGESDDAGILNIVHRDLFEAADEAGVEEIEGTCVLN